MLKKPISTFARGWAPSVVSAILLVLGLSCGKSSSDDSETAEATPTPTPTATEIPETSPSAFWLSQDTGAGPVAVRFDSEGRRSLIVDLFESGLDLGTITSFSFMDASTLLFFVKPGSETSVPTFGTIDISTGLLKNKAWGSESSIREKFKDNSVHSMVSGLQSGVLHTQTADGVKIVRYNNDGGLRAEDFYGNATLTDCPSDEVTGVVLVSGADAQQMLVMSGGDSHRRINVVGIAQGAPSCRSSFDYSSGSTTAAHKAVNAVQMPDGKVYVLYQHATDPMIVRYDYDGEKLSNNTVMIRGLGNLGEAPFGMIARTNKKLLVARPDVSALIEISLRSDGGEQTDFYMRSSFVRGLKAMIAEPLQ
jgi:hypothetical protein